MTTTMKCLVAFVLFCGVVFAQNQQDGNPTNYLFKFEVLNVDASATDAIVKDIKAFSKDLFESHPTFSQGVFTVSTAFPVPEDRIHQYLELYGFQVTSLVIEKDGHILTTKSEEQ